MKAIPVKFIRFNDATMEVPGHTSSSITSCFDPDHGKERRHKVEYHPWLRMFWVEHYDGPALRAEAKLLDWAYIPAEKAMFWKPADGPIRLETPNNKKR